MKDEFEKNTQTLKEISNSIHYVYNCFINAHQPEENIGMISTQHIKYNKIFLYRETLCHRFSLTRKAIWYEHEGGCAIILDNIETDLKPIYPPITFTLFI